MTYRKCYSFLAAVFLLFSSVLLPSINASAEPADYAAQADARKTLPVESNQWENWPYGPEIGAQSAILMEVNTGTILYSKNIHDQLYPASITKVLTALITMENCALDETVAVSYDAVNSIDWRTDSNIELKPGDQITVEQALYGLLVGSANEAGNALGEHISGTTGDFAKLMNRKAKELGCTDSNFVTTNGIFDENHYTSVHDMALIGKAFFSNELLCKMSSTPYYLIPQSPTVDKDLNVYCKNKLLEGKEYEYEYLVGSKTGYTSESRQNLISCAEKDGMKLVCVIMKEEAPNQFVDTINLFNYGFNNFQMINVADTDQNYTVKSNSFFETDHNIFGKSDQLLSIDPSGMIIIPRTASYEEALSTLNYHYEPETSTIATLEYSFYGIPVGSADIRIAPLQVSANGDQPVSQEDAPESVFTKYAPIQRTTTGHRLINVKYLVILILVCFVLIYMGINLIVLLMNYNFTSTRKKDAKRRRRRKRDSNNFDHLNFDKYVKDDDDPYVI